MHSVHNYSLHNCLIILHYSVCVCYLTMVSVQGSQGAHSDQAVILQSIGAGSPTSLASRLDPCLKGEQFRTIENNFSNLKHTCKYFAKYCSLYIT